MAKFLKYFNDTLIRILIAISVIPIVLLLLDMLMAYCSETYHFSIGEIHLRWFAANCIVFIICCATANVSKNMVRVDLISFLLMYSCYFIWTFITPQATWLPLSLVGLGIVGFGSFLLYWRICIAKRTKDTREQKSLSATIGKTTGTIQPDKSVPLDIAPIKSMKTITPLLEAIITGDREMVRTALQNHPEYLNTAYAQNGNTPLHVAALNGQTEIVKLLLEQPGIDKTLKNNEGKTAADLAQEKDFTEIAQLLN